MKLDIAPASVILLEDLAGLVLAVVEVHVGADRPVVIIESRSRSDGRGRPSRRSGPVGDDRHHEADPGGLEEDGQMRTKAITVDTSRPSVPARSSRKAVEGGAPRGAER